MDASTNLFRPAEKEVGKARIAIDGPPGSGKTFTALLWARALAGPDGKIALVDTEQKRSLQYGRLFRFDRAGIEEPYNPDRLVEHVRNAQANGYDVLVVDSGSHFWTAEGGLLDIVDKITASGQFGNNSQGAWAEASPIQRRMVKALLAFDGHLIVTLRSKVEWEVGAGGKFKKVGTTAEQRAGFEYEFDLVLRMGSDNSAEVEKSTAYAVIKTGQTIAPNDAKDPRVGATTDTAAAYLAWLNDGEPYMTPEQQETIREMVKLVPRGPDRQAVIETMASRFGPIAEMRAAMYDAVFDYVNGALPEEHRRTPPAPPAQPEEAPAAPVHPAIAEFDAHGPNLLERVMVGRAVADFAAGNSDTWHALV